MKYTLRFLTEVDEDATAAYEWYEERGGTPNLDSWLSWTPTYTERAWSHGYATELLC